MSTKELDCESIRDSQYLFHNILKDERKEVISTQKRLSLIVWEKMVDTVCDTFYNKCISLKKKPD